MTTNTTPRMISNVNWLESIALNVVYQLDSSVWAKAGMANPPISVSIENNFFMALKGLIHFHPLGEFPYDPRSFLARELPK